MGEYGKRDTESPAMSPPRSEGSTMKYQERTLGAMVAAMVIAAACSEAPAEMLTSRGGHGAHAAVATQPLTQQQKAEVQKLKAEMARYHSFKQAKADGYDTDITGCLSD